MLWENSLWGCYTVEGEKWGSPGSRGCERQDQGAGRGRAPGSSCSAVGEMEHAHVHVCSVAQHHAE